MKQKRKNNPTFNTFQSTSNKKILLIYPPNKILILMNQKYLKNFNNLLKNQ